MTPTIDLSGPQECPRCGKLVLVRRHATSGPTTPPILLDADPSNEGTWMVTRTTAQTGKGRGGLRHQAHALTCKPPGVML